MCSAPKVPAAPPPPPPPPEPPKPYIPQVAPDPGLSAQRQLAMRLGTNQLVIPFQAINPL